MKKESMKKKTVTVFAAAAAALMLATALSGCGGSSGGANSALNASHKYADGILSKYVSSKNAASFAFTDEACAKATLASMFYTKDVDAEGMQKIARNLFADSITVTDDKGVVAASYPEGDEGKKLTELGERAVFNKVVKGMSEKLTTEPVLDEETGEYSLFAGVGRTDEGGTVIVGYKTKDYGDVCGDTLAQKCGVNTIVLQNDEVISSTLDGAKRGASLDSLGVKNDDLGKESFSFTVDGTKYTGSASVKDKLVVISAVPA